MLRDIKTGDLIEVSTLNFYCAHPGCNKRADFRVVRKGIGAAMSGPAYEQSEYCDKHLPADARVWRERPHSRKA